MNDNLFANMLAGLEDGFAEMDSNITINLPTHDEKYVKIKERLGQLEREYPFVEQVLDGDGSIHLSADEHAGLVEYIRTSDKAEDRERLNLYLAGHRDCIAYLKRVGVL